MAGIVARLVTSLDRIPAPQAFAFAALVGAVEGFILFTEDGLPQIPFLAYSVPIVAYIGLMLLATALVGFSRPVVTRRETGSVGGRSKVILLNFGRLTLFYALVAALFVVPVVVYKMNKWSQSPPSVGRFDDTTSSTTPSSVAHSATPNPSTAPSAAAMTSPEPNSSAAPSSSSVAPTIATTSSKAAVRAPAKAIADKPEQPRSRTLGDAADP